MPIQAKIKPKLKPQASNYKIIVRKQGGKNFKVRVQGTGFFLLSLLACSVVCFFQEPKIQPNWKHTQMGFLGIKEASFRTFGGRKKLKGNV